MQVRWARENYAHDLGSPYSLRLASADTGGSIIVWDVAAGEPKSEFGDGNKPIQGGYILESFKNLFSFLNFTCCLSY